MTKSDSGVQVIARAAAILREVAARPEGLSLGQLASATGLARSTVQRIVDALAGEHLVQGGAGGVRPGWGLRRLGELAGPGVAPVLRPALYRLFEQTQSSVDLSTLTGSEVLFLDRFLSHQPARAVAGSGARFPAYSMANGKALLAQLSNDAVRALYGDGALPAVTAGTIGDVVALLEELDAIRSGGFARDLEEHAEGVCALGLPVPGEWPSPLAMSVVVPAAHYEANRARIEVALRRCVGDCASG